MRFVGYIGGGETADHGACGCTAMADRIRHRGPDDADYYMDGDIALGFRRLSIIDLEGGRQPILNEDKSKVLMFNGEIYNYQSIREDLLKAGHVFKTKTDSEVILHGYEEYGKKVLDRLRGMFAFIEDWGREKECHYCILVSGLNRTGAHKFYDAIGYSEVKGFKKYL